MRDTGMINKTKDLPWSGSIAQWLRQFGLRGWGKNIYIYNKILKNDLDALSLKNSTIRDDLITECDHIKVRKGDALNSSLSF